MWCHLSTGFKLILSLRFVALSLLFIAFITTLLFATSAYAAPSTNKVINFQGRLQTASGTVVPDGYYNMQFKIYQDGTGATAGNPGGTLKWTESYINNGGFNSIQVRNGYFSVSLGSVNTFGTSVDWDQDTLFLSMNVAGSAAGCTAFGTAPCAADGEMLPMKRITAAPYAINSGAVGGKTADNLVQLAQGVQTDASTNTSSIHINKTGSGNLIQLQNTAADVFTVTNTGNLTLGSNANKSISIATSGAGTDGRQLTVSAGGGGSSGNGGDLTLQGGGSGSVNANGANGPSVITSESFEAQPNGTNLATSNTIYDTVFTNGSATFSNEWAIKGTRSAKYVTQANAIERFTARNQVASRWYMMLPSLPANNTSLAQASLSGSIAAQVGIFTDGTVRLRNGGIAGGPATSVLPLSTAIRVEWKINSTTGVQEAQFYWGANLHGTTPNTATSSTGYSGSNVDALSTAVNIAATGYTMYVDEWAYGADWVGPLLYESAAGGNVQIDAGSGNGGGSDGYISIGTSSASSITIGSTYLDLNQTIQVGANNTAGSVSNVIIGAGESAAGGSTTIRAKETITISTDGVTRATFADDENAVYFGNGVTAAAPNDFTLQGTGSTTSGVDGGSLAIQGGGATAGNTNGGNVTLAGGSGSGTGASGLVVINTPTFSTVTNDANCYAGGSLVAASCTITATSVNNAASVIVGFSAAEQTASLPDPSITTAGRIMYITGADSSQNFTLSINGGGVDNQIAMRENITTTLLWNGSDWTVASAAATTTPFSINNTTENGTPNVQIGDGIASGGPTLLTVDKAASAPMVTDNALLGSMYYDTTIGKLQCYEADGWGSCGSSPDNFVTLSPEYTNAVTNGTGIGTMTSDICSDTLNINDGSSSQPTICGTNETYNFYNWASAEATAQTKSIYVTYKLPSTFKDFAPGSTSLMGRTDNADATVSYQIYRNNTSTGLSACGSSVAVSTGVQTTWQTAVATGSADPSTCNFAANDSIVIKINLTAKSVANAYVSNLGFTYSNN